MVFWGRHREGNALQAASVVSGLRDCIMQSFKWEMMLVGGERFSSRGWFWNIIFGFGDFSLRVGTPKFSCYGYCNFVKEFGEKNVLDFAPGGLVFGSWRMLGLLKRHLFLLKRLVLKRASVLWEPRDGSSGVELQDISLEKPTMYWDLKDCKLFFSEWYVMVPTGCHGGWSRAWSSVL